MSKRLWVQLLLLSLFASTFFYGVTADGDDDDGDDEGGEDWAEDLGDPARVLLIITVSLVVWNPLHVYLQKTGLKTHGEKFGITDVKAAKKKLVGINKWMKTIHIWVGLAAVIVGLIHGIGTQTPDWESAMAWAGWLGMLAMTILGYLMHWKWPPKKVRKGARALHTQRIILVLTIAFLFFGHEML